MLDENLPCFYVKTAAADGVPHHRDVHFSHNGSHPAPAYALHTADPATPSPAHKNCYGAALFDAYNPDVLFGEVLARPDWTQSTLNQDDIRRNGGIPPPPQPVLPHDFAIQLYNPDQQVKVDVKEGKWGASDSYEFSLPSIAFRTPSASHLDRGQSDPAILPITPKIHFVWRRESKLSKDLTCYMTGKSTDTDTKKRSKRDPDIAVALWRSQRELTIYESNLDRLELEDPKGVEVVLLLSAIAIRDLWFVAHKDGLRGAFNITGLPNGRKLSGGGRKLSNPNRMPNALSIVGAPALSHHPPSIYASDPPSGAPTPSSHQQKPAHNASAKLLPSRQGMPPPATIPPPSASSNSKPPPHADPRSKWELDAETARLKAQADAEAKAELRRQKEKAKADEAERKRLQRMVAEEERIRRNKDAEIERETERLRRLYGVPNQQHQHQQQQHAANIARPHTSMATGRPPPQPQHQRPNHGGGGGSGMMMSGGNGNGGGGAPAAASSSSCSLTLGQLAHQAMKKKKSSFFGLRGGSVDEGAPAVMNGGSGSGSGSGRLVKKGSAMW
jgi:hypothetical protein